MPLIETFITAQNFDITCLLETFLNSDTDICHTRKNINGYSLLQANHPSNTKHGGVCMYYKEYLPLTRRNDFPNPQECLATEITVGKEK